MTKFNEQILIFAGDEKEIEKKKKKGNLLSNSFKLMQSLVSLQEEIEEVKESLDDNSVIEKLKAFDAHIDAMYDTLQNITADGVKAIRKRDGLENNSIDELNVTAPEPTKPSVVTSPKLPTPPQ